MGNSEIQPPRVDILMATYNGETFIAEQIESIQAQSYTNWRLLINDDGSTDSTVDIVKAYVETDSRIVLMDLRNVLHGAAGNFLALLAAAEAPYIMFCDQDDVWLPHKVEIELDAIIQMEQRYGAETALLSFTDAYVVDEHLNVIEESLASHKSFDLYDITVAHCLVSCPFPGCTVALNRALAELTLSIPMSKDFEMHDYWVATLAVLCGKTRYIPVQSLKYRQHANNTCGWHELATLKAGISNVIKQPSILRGFLRRLSLENKAFEKRARYILEELKTFDRTIISSETRKTLESLSCFGNVSVFAKLRIINRNKLIKERANLYEKVLQFAGLLLP